MESLRQAHCYRLVLLEATAAAVSIDSRSSVVNLMENGRGYFGSEVLLSILIPRICQHGAFYLIVRSL